MFLRQALRYRWSQMLVLAGVSLLIGTCAAFAPWFSRAVEQTVTTETLNNQWLSAAWQLEGTPPPFAGGPTTSAPPEDLVKIIPDDLLPLFSPPSLGMTVAINWGLQSQKTNIGTTIKAISSQYAGGGTLRVVGVYRADDLDKYWYGRGPTGHSLPASETRPAASDFLLTGRDTLTKGWGHALDPGHASAAGQGPGRRSGAAPPSHRQC